MDRTGISVGIHIKRALEGLGANVYHIVAPEGSNSPNIVYRRVGLRLAGDKCDDESIETAFVEVAIITPSYPEGVDLAEKVRLSLRALEDEGKVETLSLVDASEDYDFNANQYIQTLTIEVEINKDNIELWEE